MLFDPRPGDKATHPDLTDKNGKLIVITVGFQDDHDITRFTNKPESIPTTIYNCTYTDRNGIEVKEKFDASDLSPVDEDEDLSMTDEGQNLPTPDKK